MIDDIVLYAPLDLAADYVALGWMPRDLSGTPHGRHRVLMVWRCACGRGPPRPKRQHSQRHADAEKALQSAK